MAVQAIGLQKETGENLPLKDYLLILNAVLPHHSRGTVLSSQKGG